MQRFFAAAGIGILALVCLGLRVPAAQAACIAPGGFTYKHGVVAFTERGATARVRVEIADSEVSQETGLMCRTSLAPDAGMLFWFRDDTDTPFWMKNTLIPLSIAFIDKSWRIVALMDMPVAPDPSGDQLPTYGPKTPYRYALEVNQGFFTQHGIDAAAQVSFMQTDPGR